MEFCQRKLFCFYLIVFATSLVILVDGAPPKSMALSIFGDSFQETLQHQMELGGSLFKQFEEFMLTYGKKYKSAAEMLMRFANFKASLKVIDALNAAADSTVRYGINSLSDLSLEEFRSTLVFKPSLNVTREQRRGDQNPLWRRLAARDNIEGDGSVEFESNSDGLPDAREEDAAQNASRDKDKYPPKDDSISKDDSTKKDDTQKDDSPQKENSATPEHSVFDLTMEPYPAPESQGQCGSCYAFAIAGAIGIVHVKNTKKIENLSEQQIIDCTKEGERDCESCGGNAGCDGGDFPGTLEYAKKTGLVVETNYPYTAEVGTCQADLKPVVFVDTFTRVTGEDLLAALRTTPLPTCVNAATEEFKNYVSGILRPEPCDPQNLNHAVVAVGYKKVGNEVILKIRNSWGTGWGVKGHFEMPMGVCGLGAEAFTFTLKTSGD